MSNIKILDMLKEKVKGRISEGVNKKRFKPVFVIVLGFIVLILLGSLLLSLPFTHKPGIEISYIDALFTSVSASCVTGLFTLPGGIIGNFNSIGIVIIMILIQLGGLGAAIVGAFIFIIVSKHLSFDQQSIIKESWNLSGSKGLKKIFGLVFLIVFSSELVGAILLFLDFRFVHPEYFGDSLYKTIGAAVFTSISAFNNAGFDLFGAASLGYQQNDYFLLIVIAILIIGGGLGFMVWIDIFKKKFHWKKFTFHTKVVLFMTVALLLIGTLLIFLSENVLNDLSYSSGSPKMTFFGSFFMSVSCRTAGFSMYNLGETRSTTLIIMMILMIIGASPGGTGGGIKTTTFYVVILRVISLVSKKKSHGFGRSVPSKSVTKAMMIFFLTLVLIITAITLISSFEGEGNYIKDGIVYKTPMEGAMRYGTLDYMTEICSAVGTVGLSTGITSYLGVGSKIVLIVLMYFGRLGPLSITQIFNKKEPNWSYPEEDITIG